MTVGRKTGKILALVALSATIFLRNKTGSFPFAPIHCGAISTGKDIIMSENEWITTLIAYLFAEDIRRHPMPAHRVTTLLQAVQEISPNIETREDSG